MHGPIVALVQIPCVLSLLAYVLNNTPEGIIIKIIIQTSVLVCFMYGPLY